MFHLSDLPLCLHWPHTGVIACRDLSAQFNTKKEEKNWQGKKQMVMLPPDMSAIHIHNLPVWAAREQALTAGGLALLQEFCKHRNWTPAIIVPKQYFRVYLSTEKKSINQSIKSLLQPGPADSGFMHHQQDPSDLTSYPAIMYLSLSSTLKRQSSESLLAQKLFHSCGNTFILAALFWTFSSFNTSFRNEGNSTL